MSTQEARPEGELTIQDFMSDFERLTGTTTVVETQHEDTDRVVDDRVARDVQAGLEDGHDYSDCGGDT